jgi:hypothetical protein
MKAISAKEGMRLLQKQGLEPWDNDQQKTFYAKDETDQDKGVWCFDSKAKRDRFVRNANSKNNN